MKFILVGDSHYTNKRPVSRTDADYGQTCLHKWWQIFRIARERGACILQAGDLFDSARLSIQGILPLLRLFLVDGDTVYAVAGQHDLWYHNPDRSNTPMGLMETTSSLTVLGADPVRLLNSPVVDVYGASWGEEIPDIINPDAFNVLVTHRMVIKDTDSLVWHGQEEYTTSHELLRKTSFDLILSGDNHQSFIAEAAGRFVVNPGSLLRSTIAQMGHVPAVWVFDTDTRGLEKVALQVEPSESVLDAAAAENSKQANERLEAFISGLKEDRDATLNFKDNVMRALEQQKVPQDVKDIVLNCLKEG